MGDALGGDADCERAWICLGEQETIRSQDGASAHMLCSDDGAVGGVEWGTR